MIRWVEFRFTWMAAAYPAPSDHSCHRPRFLAITPRFALISRSVRVPVGEPAPLKIIVSFSLGPRDCIPARRWVIRQAGRRLWYLPVIVFLLAILVIVIGRTSDPDVVTEVVGVEIGVFAVLLGSFYAGAFVIWVDDAGRIRLRQPVSLTVTFTEEGVRWASGVTEVLHRWPIIQRRSSRRERTC